VLSLSVIGQCPQLYDYDGVPSGTPTWYSCSGANYTLVLATPNAVADYSIDWGAGGPLQIGASLAPPQTVTHLYPVSVAEYTITFTELATGCQVIGTLIMEESSSASIQIPVGGLTQVCAPQAVQFTNSSTNVSPNTVFEWDFGDGSPIQTMDHTNFGQTISHMYMPGTVSCETTVRLTAANECNTLQGGVSVATFNPIRIWDLDTAVITPSATLLCWPDNEVTFLNNSLRNCINQGNIYQRYEYWNFGDYWGTGQDSILNWTPWPVSFLHTIAYPAIGSYDVVMLDSNVCGIDTARITINIIPPPSVTLSVSPDTVCAGETVTFNQTTNGGANYFEWDFDNGAGFNWTAAGDQSHTFNTVGTYTVGYTASVQSAAGCADTAYVDIVVLPSPTAAFTLDISAACNTLTVNCTNTTAGALQYLWDFGDGSTSSLLTPAPHTYNTPGEYTISLTATNALQCSDVTTRIVNVFEPPVVQIGAQNVCEGETASFIDLSTFEVGNEITTWSWDLGDGTTSSDESPYHLYTGSGTYSVTLDVTTPYCASSGALSVTVEAKPIADVTPSAQIGCSPMLVDLTNNSIGGTTADWTFGDGGTSTSWSASHTYINTGTQDSIYTVQLIVGTGTGCSDTTTTLITVSPPVHAQFSHNAMPGCAPFDVDFTNQSTAANSYEWNFGDGTTSTLVSPSHQYVNISYFLDIHTITLIANSSSGCADTVSQQILVYPTPEFNFTALPDSGCSPLSVTFPSVVGAVSYEWDYGDGTTGTGPSPTHIFVNNSTNDLQLPVTLIGANAFGCMDTTSSIVTVYPDPTAQFSLDTVAGCHPFTAQMTNQSTGANEFHWTYGDGMSSDTTDAVHAHSWTNYSGPWATNFNVSLTVSTDHGCTSTVSETIQVYPLVTSGFVTDTSGCAPLNAAFANVSSGASAYTWDFGDGQTDTLSSPSHIYANQGLNDVVFNASLIATNSFGCTDTAYAQMFVHPQPIAQFVPSSQAGCQPLLVDLEDLSIGATNLAWDLGDGQTVNGGPGNVSHTYSNTSSDPVLYDPVLIASTIHGCSDTATSQIEVFPPITAVFSIDTVVCSPFISNIINSSVGAVNYLWTMGDGVILAEQNPIHTYVNSTNSIQTRVITLTTTSAYGCTATSSVTIQVHPVPNAALQATPFTQQFPNATVNFANNSAAGAWTYLWNLDDGTTFNTQTITAHTYSTWGTYQVSLIVSSAICSDTAIQEVVILPPLPTANFIGSGEGCVPLTVDFTNTSWQGLTYLWQFGDGSTSSADDPIYTFNVPGTYTVTLTAYGQGGMTSLATKVDSVIVHPKATAFFVSQPEEVVVPSETVYFYNLSSNATDYSWQFGDGVISTDMNPEHNYLDPGTYDVVMIANNQWNCPDTFTVIGAVTGEAAGDLQFPNAFTPALDGPTNGEYDPRSFENHFFFPLHSGVEQFDLKIYDRWGELIFATTDIMIGWDGYYRGEPAKQDVYVWKAFAKFSDGRETVQKGDLTLLR